MADRVRRKAQALHDHKDTSHEGGKHGGSQVPQSKVVGWDVPGHWDVSTCSGPADGEEV